MGIPLAILFVGIDSGAGGWASFASRYGDRLMTVPPIDDSPAILARSHALLMTSRKEGCPLTALEAFCLGKPVVGTDVPGIRDVVRHEGNGILCEQDPGSVSSALVRIVTEVPLYNRLCTNALESGKAIDEDFWVDQYVQLYRRLAG